MSWDILARCPCACPGGVQRYDRSVSYNWSEAFRVLGSESLRELDGLTASEAYARISRGLVYLDGDPEEVLARLGRWLTEEACSCWIVEVR